MLTKTETKQLVKLLKKVKNPNRGLPEPLFLALSKIVPFASCEMAIVNEKKELLMAWRDDEWWTGWHFPGGVMRYGESFEMSLQNTARRELGIKLKSYKFLFPVNYTNSERGHTVSFIFLCTTGQKPKDGKFFKTMPKNIISLHKPVWRQVQKMID